MDLRLRAWLAPAVVLTALVSACGDGSETGNGGAAGSTQGAGACDGFWGHPTPVLSLLPNLSLRGGPAVAFGGLVLLYVALDENDASLTFHSAVRGSTGEAFGTPEPVGELQEACGGGEPHGIDLSEDGLRAYVSCHDGTGSRIVRMAVRPTLADPFTLGSDVAVQPAEDETVYGAARLSRDELTLYVNGTTAGAPSLMASRSATSEPFATYGPIPGLESVALLYPAPSPDGLSLVGATTASGVEALAYVRRPDLASAYGPLTYLFAGSGYTSVPEVSADCRTLYVGATASVFALSR